MPRIPLKPHSTNRLYRGRRWKTPEATAFEKSFQTLLLIHLPRPVIPEGDLTIHWQFGIARRMDVTNCIKLAEDVLATHCGFNDNRVRKTIAVKHIVPKGQEFIDFEITAYQHDA